MKSPHTLLLPVSSRLNSHQPSCSLVKQNSPSHTHTRSHTHTAVTSHRAPGKLFPHPCRGDGLQDEGGVDRPGAGGWPRSLRGLCGWVSYLILLSLRVKWGRYHLPWRVLVRTKLENVC